MAKKNTLVTLARNFGSKLSKVVSETVLEQAQAMIPEVHSYAFDLENPDDCITREEAAAVAEEIVSDMPKGASRNVRKSEWTNFVYAAWNSGLEDCLASYVERYPDTLTRVRFFALCGALAKDETHVKAIKAAKDAGTKGKGNGAGKTATLEMGLGIIKNAETSKHMSKTKLNAFRRELKKLVEEHGGKY